MNTCIQYNSGEHVTKANYFRNIVKEQMRENESYIAWYTRCNEKHREEARLQNVRLATIRKINKYAPIKNLID